MITHVVSFSWKPGITADVLTEIGAALDALPGQIDAIRSYRHGADIGASSLPNHDYAVVATFDDVDGWRAYDTHPAHDAVRANLLRPWISERAAVQFAG